MKKRSNWCSWLLRGVACVILFFIRFYSFLDTYFLVDIFFLILHTLEECTGSGELSVRYLVMSACVYYICFISVFLSFPGLSTAKFNLYLQHIG